jgi:tetratricopeptide (TPR) repeat protein
MLIVFGTTTVGKRDRIRVRTTCPHCGTVGALLQSYTTMECAHVYWIPLIPLGRRRLVMECPACKRGYKFNLRSAPHCNAIETTRQKAAELARQADPQVMGQIAMLTHLCDFEGAEAAIAQLQGAAPPALHSHAAAWYWELRGDADKADEHYRRAVEADDTGEVWFEYGEFLLACSQDEQALEALRRAREMNPALDYLAPIHVAALARKQKKNFSAMLLLMDELVRLNPALMQDRRFAKQMATAQKKCGHVPDTDNPYAGGVA